jgi:hypothetical protein
MNVCPVRSRTNFSRTHSSTSTLTGAPFPRLIPAPLLSRPPRHYGSPMENFPKTLPADSRFADVRKAMPQELECPGKPDRRPRSPDRRGQNGSTQRVFFFRGPRLSFNAVLVCVSLDASASQRLKLLSQKPCPISSTIILVRCGRTHSPNVRAQFGGAPHRVAGFDVEGVEELLVVDQRPYRAETPGRMRIDGD